MSRSLQQVKCSVTLNQYLRSRLNPIKVMQGYYRKVNINNTYRGKYHSHDYNDFDHNL